MRKIGVQYICDVCGRTMFMEGQRVNGRTKSSFPLGWIKVRKEKTRYLCGLCASEYEQAKQKIREFEGRAEPEQTEPINGDIVSLDSDGFQVE